jgi:hypothetical protein
VLFLQVIARFQRAEHLLTLNNKYDSERYDQIVRQRFLDILRLKDADILGGSSSWLARTDGWTWRKKRSAASVAQTGLSSTKTSTVERVKMLGVMAKMMTTKTATRMTHSAKTKRTVRDPVMMGMEIPKAASVGPGAEYILKT